MQCIDLHTHTDYSDGSLSPESLVRMAVDKGLGAIAVTDHDTMSGVDSALAAGVSLGIEVVAGVEISCMLDDLAVHLLGYFLDHHDQNLALTLAMLQGRRHERNQQMILRLTRMGIDLSIEDLIAVSGHGEAGRPHMAALLVARGVASSTEDAFRRFLRRGSPAYVARARFDLSDAVAMIRAGGGLPVLAHPASLPPVESDTRAFFVRLRDMGVQGVEVFYPSHSQRAVAKMLTAARESGLLVTGGSDFHGTEGRNDVLGRGALSQSISIDILHRMKERALRPDHVQGNAAPRRHEF